VSVTSIRPVSGLDDAVVAELPAALGVEGGARQDDLDLLALLGASPRSPPGTTSADGRVSVSSSV
jgi:hypothetical protein